MFVLYLIFTVIIVKLLEMLSFLLNTHVHVVQYAYISWRFFAHVCVQRYTLMLTRWYY